MVWCFGIETAFCLIEEMVSLEQAWKDESTQQNTAKTAKCSGMDSFDCLLQEMPKLGENPAQEQRVPLLPWAESLPAYCKRKSF